MPDPASRTKKIGFRISPDAKRLSQTAASASRHSLSELVLESALARAAETPPDRGRFGLDAPPRPLPRPRRLLSEPSAFEEPAPR